MSNGLTLAANQSARKALPNGLTVVANQLYFRIESALKIESIRGAEEIQYKIGQNPLIQDDGSCECCAGNIFPTLSDKFGLNLT